MKMRLTSDAKGAATTAQRSYARRDVLKLGMAGASALLVGPGNARARSPVKAAQVTAVLYCAHLVAEAGGYWKKEGLDVELVNSPAGARSAQMVGAGQVHSVLGDSAHPQWLTPAG